MENILLNEGNIVTVNNEGDAFDLIRENLSEDLGNYLEREFGAIEAATEKKCLEKQKKTNKESWKNMKVFYNDDTGEFEVWYNEEYSENFYDNPEENTVEKVQKFIDRW